MMMLVGIFVILGLAYHASAGCYDRGNYVTCKLYKWKGYCDGGKYQPWMRQNCAKTCDFCNKPLPADCQDVLSYCDTFVDECYDPDYKDYLSRKCKRTCNFCHITTQPPPTTQFVPTKPHTDAGGTDLQPGCGHKGPGHTRIVGGTNAKPGDWPWQASIHYYWSPGIKQQWCGGTLIDEQWVLSAAHCFEDDMNPKSYWFKLGGHNLRQKSTYQQTRRALEVHVHPKYDSDTADYDLALIKLESKVQLNERVRTACLPGPNTDFPVGTNCTISGWGTLEEDGYGPVILQQAQVPLASKEDCEKAYEKEGEQLTPRMICAGEAKGIIDSCQGDSGGPLVCPKGDTWYLVGATSWGVGCARRGLFGVYSDVKVMRQWVDKVVFNV